MLVPLVGVLGDIGATLISVFDVRYFLPGSFAALRKTTWVWWLGKESEKPSYFENPIWVGYPLHACHPRQRWAGLRARGEKRLGSALP
jgi:hypothetical protein